MIRRSTARVRHDRAAVLGPEGLRLRFDRSDLAVRLLLHRARGEHAEALAAWARLRRAGWGAQVRAYLQGVSS